jgi:DNA-binding transcriptional regulator LsrR (DeoR family)
MTEQRADSMLARRVAIMHFIDRETNLTIADKLGISRFRVA